MPTYGGPMGQSFLEYLAQKQAAQSGRPLGGAGAIANDLLNAPRGPVFFQKPNAPSVLAQAAPPVTLGAPAGATVQPGAAILAKNAGGMLGGVPQYLAYLQGRQYDPAPIAQANDRPAPGFTPSFDPRSQARMLIQMGVDPTTAAGMVTEAIAKEQETYNLNAGINASTQAAAATGGTSGINPLTVPATIAGMGMEALDEPRQAVVAQAGEAAYNYWTGQDLGKTNAVMADISHGWTYITRGGPFNAGASQDAFVNWFKRPENRDKIVDAYENGYNGFSGGRAIWELYQADTTGSGFWGALERGLNDVPMDPLNWAAMLSLVGKPLQVAGRGFAALGDSAAIAPGASDILTTIGRGLGITGDILHFPQGTLDKGPDIIGTGVKAGAHGGLWLARAAEEVPVLGRPIRALDLGISKAFEYSPRTKANMVKEDLLHWARGLYANYRRGQEYFGYNAPEYLGIGEMHPTGAPGPIGNYTPGGPGGGPSWWNGGGNWDGLTDVNIGGARTDTMIRKRWTPAEIADMGGEFLPSHTNPSFNGDWIDFPDYSVRQTGTDEWTVFSGNHQVGAVKTEAEAKALARKTPNGSYQQTGRDEWSLFDNLEWQTPAQGNAIAKYTDRDSAISALANRRKHVVRVHGKLGGYDGLIMYDRRTGEKIVTFANRYIVASHREQVAPGVVETFIGVLDNRSGELVLAHDWQDAYAIVADDLDTQRIARGEAYRPYAKKPNAQPNAEDRATQRPAGGLPQGQPVAGPQPTRFEVNQEFRQTDFEKPPVATAFDWRQRLAPANMPTPPVPEPAPITQVAPPVQEAAPTPQELLNTTTPTHAGAIKVVDGYGVYHDTLNPGDFELRRPDGTVALRGIQSFAVADDQAVRNTIAKVEGSKMTISRRERLQAQPEGTRAVPNRYAQMAKNMEWRAEKRGTQTFSHLVTGDNTPVDTLVFTPGKGNENYQVISPSGEIIPNPLTGGDYWQSSDAKGEIVRRWERRKAGMPQTAAPEPTPPPAQMIPPEPVPPAATPGGTIPSEPTPGQYAATGDPSWQQLRNTLSEEERAILEHQRALEDAKLNQYDPVPDWMTGERIAPPGQLHPLRRREGAIDRAPGEAPMSPYSPDYRPPEPTVPEPATETPPIEPKHGVVTVGEPSQTLSGEARSFDVPIADLRTDPARFQPRETLNREHVDYLKSIWDPRKVDPITVWRDPQDGQLYVLAGHHRLEAARELGNETIPAREFVGTPEEAIRFAEDSNQLALPQTPTENGATYLRRYHDGESWAKIARAVPGQPSARRVQADAMASLLVPTMRELYNNGQLPREAATRLGDLVLTDPVKYEPEKLWVFWRDKILPGKPNGSPFTNDEVNAAIDLFRGVVQDSYRAGGDLFSLMGSADFSASISIKQEIDGLEKQISLFRSVEKQAGRESTKTAINLELGDIVERLKAKLRAAGLDPSMADRLRGDSPERIVFAFAPERLVKFAEQRARLRAMFENTPSAPDVRDLESGLIREDLRTPPTNATPPTGTIEPLPGKTALEAFRFGGAPEDPIFQNINGLEAAQRARKAAAQDLPAYRRLWEKKQAWMRSDILAATRLTKQEEEQLKIFAKRWDDILNIEHITVEPNAVGHISRDQIDAAAVGLLGKQIGQQLEWLDPRIKDRRGWLTRAYDTAVQLWREFKLLAPQNLIRYVLGNSLGDSLNMVLNDRPGAAATWIRDAPGFWRELVNHEVGAYLDTAPGRTLRALELGGLHGELGRGHSQIVFSAAGQAMETTSAWRRFGNKFHGGWLGRPIEFGRNINNALEFSRRATLWNQAITEDLRGQYDEFGKYLVDLFRRNNVNVPEDKIWGLFTALTTEPRRDVFDVIPRSRLFGQTDVMEGVERLALDGGLTQRQAVGVAEQARRNWQSRVVAADKAARKVVAETLFDYNYRNIDVWLSRIVPFHFWATRAIPFYLEQAMRHPGMANGFFRAIDATEKWNEANGAPESVRKYFKVLNSVFGYSVWINPLTAIIPTYMLDIQYHPSGTGDKRTEFEKWIDKGSVAGIGLYPWLKGLMANAGMITAQYNSDFTGTYAERMFMVNTGAFLAQQLGSHLAGENWRSLKFQRDLIGDMFGWAANKNPLHKIVPFAHQPRYTGSIQGPLTAINADIERRVREEMGITGPLGALDDATLEAYYNRVGQIQADQNDPIWQAAYDDVTRAGMMLGAMRATVPGSKKIVQTESTRQSAVYGDKNAPGTSFDGVTVPAWETDPAVLAASGGPAAADAKAWKEQYARITGTRYTEGALERAKEFRYVEAEITKSTPEWGRMLLQDFEYENLGTPAQRAKANAYYDVVFAGETPDWNAGDAWLTANDPTGEVGKLIQLQQAFAETHAQYGQYLDWRKTYRGAYQGTDGAARYRAETSKVNANAKQFYLDQLTSYKASHPNATLSEINKHMEIVTWSIEAYGAVYGMKKRPGTPRLNTSQNQVSQAPVAADAGASGTGSTTPSQRTAELTQQVTDYLAQEKQADALIQQLTGRPGGSFRNLPPPVQSMFGMEYGAQFPALFGPHAGDVQDYLAWQSQAMAMGTDASIANYVNLSFQGRVQKNRRVDFYIPGMRNQIAINSGGGYLGSSFSGQDMGGMIPGVGAMTPGPSSYLQSIPGMPMGR